MGASEDLIDALVADLRQLRHDVGQPSFRELEIHARKVGNHLPASTASDAVRGRRLPKLTVVIAFVLACRHYAEEFKIPVPAKAREMYSWQEAHEKATLTLTAPLREDQVDALPRADHQPPRPHHGKHFWMPERQRCLYLLIGSGEVPGLGPILAPRDCKFMAAALQNTAPWMSVSMLINPTNQEAHKAVCHTLTERSELVVVHVVGHGFLNESARLSLPLRDSQEDNLLQTTLDLEGLLAQASHHSRERAVILIVDTGYAGSAIPQVPPGLEHWYVLAATGPRGHAYEWGGPAGRGSFTGVLAQLLQDGIPNCPYPMVTVIDLAQAAREIVLRRTSDYGINSQQVVTWSGSESIEALGLAYNRPT
ncbi:hypothetical protein [Streptomyces chiangmaiensis]|uniref:Uncharacterized protein n=1 Tax=Streptomyces chiangmaiensis TaxID=766497 RepID=A0ABU7FPV3_9ACTN|nr:hypothetical protein [Streptomyces chiangmaiensis]MED7826127.1 hypothetical protein [Streptomyces chiangmaiensis]